MFARRKGVYPDGESPRDEEALQRRMRDMLEVVYPEIKKHAEEASEKGCEAANDRRATTDVIFPPGEVVMQEQNIMAKQDDRFDGPFRIREYDAASRKYTLEGMGGEDLRGSECSHDKLKRVRADVLEEEDEGEKFQVTWIEDVRAGEDGQEYKVKWTSWKERTWEHESNLVGAERAIENFWRKRKKAQKSG